MNPISVELSLGVKPSYVPKSLSSLLFDLSRIDNEYYKLSVLSDYICKHEQELTRVEALMHQLPQCRLLLYEAIQTLKEEFFRIKNNMQTKTKDNEREEEREIHEITSSTTEEEFANKHKTLILDDSFQESTRNSIGSSSSTGNYDHSKPLTQPIWKNNRRCWSSELHSRFVDALNMLGGIQGATPKQIRDLMKVEGLTIDQVKSHLQKYRLHCGKVGDHLSQN